MEIKLWRAVAQYFAPIFLARMRRTDEREGAEGGGWRGKERREVTLRYDDVDKEDKEVGRVRRPLERRTEERKRRGEGKKREPTDGVTKRRETIIIAP